MIENFKSTKGVLVGVSTVIFIEVSLERLKVIGTLFRRKIRLKSVILIPSVLLLYLHIS